MIPVTARVLLLRRLMEEPDHDQTACIDQLLEEVQMLVHVLPMIAGKSRDPDVADELVDLAEVLDQKMERLRGAIVALLD